MSHNTIGYFLVDRLHVKDANTVSSPLTYGFPSLSGFLGAVHALSRKISLEDSVLNGVGVVCFRFEPKVFREHRYEDYKFVQTRNPLKKKGGEYKAPPIIEEGRVDLVVSLVIELVVTNPGSRKTYLRLRNEDEKAALCQQMKKHLYHQRLCGGSIMKIGQVEFFNKALASDINSRLFPGFVLMHAPDELRSIHEQLKDKDPEATALDALVETAKIEHVPSEQIGVKSESASHGRNNEVAWNVKSVKSGRGWIVPISAGFQKITRKFDIGELENSRASNYPSQYVESIYTLGKWVFSTSDLKIDNCIWRYDYKDFDKGFYVIKQNNE